MSDAPIDIGLPEKMSFTNHGTYIEFVRKWFGSKFVFLTGFVFIWNGFLYAFYGEIAGDNAELFVYLFPLIHVGVGLGLTYYVIAGWLNRTYVFADKQRIEVRHRPIPWIGARKIEALDLKQLYVKEKVSRSNNSSSHSYEVRAVTNSGKNIKILGGLEDQEQALFIEQEIEKHLKIKNAPVRGEVG